MKKIQNVINYVIIILLLGYSPHLKAQRTSITLFHGFIDRHIQEALEKLVYEFNLNYPAVQIELVHYGLEDELLQRLPLWKASGKLPDLLIWSHPFLASLSRDVHILPQNSIWEKLKLNEKVSPKILNAHRLGEQFFAFPLTTNALALMLNRSLFEKYKIDIPRTWQEWLDTIQKFHEHGFTPIYIPDVTSEWSVWFWEILYWQSGGDFKINDTQQLLLDSIAFMRSTNFYRILYESSKKIIHLRDLNYENYFHAFSRREIPMMIMGNWVYAHFRDPDFIEQLDVVPIPSPTGEEIVSNIGGESIAVLTKDTLKLEYIRKFFKFLTEKKRLIHFNQSIGTFSPIALPYQMKFIKKSIFLEKFYKIYLNGKTRPNLLYYDKFSKLMGYYLKQYLDHRITLNEFYENLTRFLAFEVKKIRQHEHSFNN